jgi:7,8-dihydroneopterin aldolase/epimerase/oxygenase
MYEITLRAMRFDALVGILEQERLAEQPIEVDLTVEVADGEEVIDYRALHAAASSVFAAGHIDYLEEIADRIADGALAHSARVRSVRVAVRKPMVMLAGPLEYAQVAVTRRAND